MRVQFENSALPALVGVNFVLGKFVVVPANNGDNLLIEQVQQFAGNLL